MENILVDRDGKPYIENVSFPAGGGLDSRCSYNALAVEAYDLPYDEFEKHLMDNGFKLLDQNEFSEVWQKENTIVFYEDYADGYYGYMTTEFTNTF